MNKSNTKCRVCGKEYFCCSDSRKVGAWKSMACSIECYKEYMTRIAESRKPPQEVHELKDVIKSETKEKILKKRKKSTVIEEIIKEKDED